MNSLQKVATLPQMFHLYNKAAFFLTTAAWCISSLLSLEGFFLTVNIHHVEKIETSALQSHAEHHSCIFDCVTSENGLLQDPELHQWPKFTLFGS